MSPVVFTINCQDFLNPHQNNLDWAATSHTMKFLLVSNVGLKILADQTVQRHRKVGRIPCGLNSEKPYSKPPVFFLLRYFGQTKHLCNSDIPNITVKLAGLVIRTLENRFKPLLEDWVPWQFGLRITRKLQDSRPTSNSAVNKSFHAISNLIQWTPYSMLCSVT